MDTMFAFLLMDKQDQGKPLLWKDQIFKMKQKGKILYQKILTVYRIIPRGIELIFS